MTTIVTRAGKGSPLTWNEVDNNFTNLNSAKYESGNNVSFGTIGGSTITASTEFSGAIGTTAPAASKFTSVSNSGNLTFTGTGNRITGDFSNGTISNRVLFQSSTTNVGSNLGLLPNGTAGGAFWNTYGSSDPTNAAEAKFGLANNSEVTIRAAITGTGTYLPMTFFTGGSERMRIDTSGNVGIGTSSPSTKLTVAGTFRVDGARSSFYANSEPYAIQLNYSTASSNGPYIGSPSADTFVVSNSGGTERMRIDSSGNVGIGVSSPAYKLDVLGDVKVGASGNILLVDGNPTTSYVVSNGNATTGVYYGNQASAPTIFMTGNTERMRIGSTGNVSIGSTDTTSYKLLVYDAADRTEGTSQFCIGGNGYSAFHWMNATAYYIGQNSASRELRMYSGATPTTGVKLTNGATSWVSTSDENLKDIIEPIENAAEKVSTLRAVIGKYKDDEEGTRRPFLIAQDVEKVLPEAIHLGSDETLNLAYTETIPLLVAAIKELKAELDTVKSELATLKGN